MITRLPNGSSFPVFSVILIALFVLTGARQASGLAVPADTLGHLSLILPVDSAFVVIDRNFQDAVLVTPEDSVLTLPAGSRHLTVSFRDFRDQTFRVDISPDTTRVIDLRTQLPLRSTQSRLLSSSFARVTWGANLTIHSDPDAEIYVEGESVGMEIAHVELPAGEYRVRAVRPDGRRLTTRVLVRDERMTVAEVYVRPEPRIFIASAFIPGAGQFYRGDNVKGSIAAATVLGLATSAVLTERSVRDRSKEFDQLGRAYRATTDERTAWELGNELEILAGRLNDTQRTRDILFGVAAGAYVAQLIDALWPPRGGFRRAVDSDYLFSPTLGPEGPGVRLQLGLD